VGAYSALARLRRVDEAPRMFSRDLVGTKFTDRWVYAAGPVCGTLAAVGAAFALRGPGGWRSGSMAAQNRRSQVEHPDKA